MFASRAGLSVGDIRKCKGDFRNTRNVAKYSTGLEQSFRTFQEIMSVYHYQKEIIPDIQVKNNGTEYCFFDGNEKIYIEFAKGMARIT